MQIKKIKLKDIEKATYNPRVNMKNEMPEEYAKLKKSIQEFGYVNLLTINQRNGKNILVGGHQRLQAMLDIYGADYEIDVTAIEVTEEKEKALNLALNKISGAWDNEKLQELLNELQDTDIDMDLTGFNLEELEQMADEMEEEFGVPAEEDDYDVDKGLEEAKKKLVSKQGDIWILGRHRLICGDATKTEDIKKLFEDRQAKLIITDPPYNVNYEGSNGLKIKNDSMSNDSFYNFLLDSYKNMFMVAEPGCPIYVFHADTEGMNFRKAFKDAGFKLAECLVWVKNSLVLGRQDYHWRHEPCLYGWKEGAAHHWYGARNKTTILGEDVDLSKLSKNELLDILNKLVGEEQELPESILWFDKPKRNDVHPTMKPIKILVYLLRNSSQKRDLVFDPFGGSGSTLIACEQSGRTCHTVEFDEKYADVIVKRYAEYTEQSEDIFLLRDGQKIPFKDLDMGAEEDGE